MISLQAFDICAKVTAAAVFHVKMQLIGRLDMVSRDVANDICML